MAAQAPRALTLIRGRSRSALRCSVRRVNGPSGRTRKSRPTRSPPRDHHRPAEAPEHQRGGDTRRRHRPRAEASHDGPPRPGAPCPPPRDRPHGKARAAQVKEAATAKRPRRGMNSPSMPASKPPCVATARSWPTAPAGDGRTQCDSMVCSTRPGRVPPVGSGLPAMRQPASLESCHRPGRTGPGPLAARPGREGYPGPFLADGGTVPPFLAGILSQFVCLRSTSTITSTFLEPGPPILPSGESQEFTGQRPFNWPVTVAGL